MPRHDTADFGVEYPNIHCLALVFLLNVVLVAGNLASGPVIDAVGPRRTLIAVLVTAVLPDGAWSPALVSSYFHGEQIVFIVLAVAVGLISGIGALTLTSSRATDEHEPAPSETAAA